MSPTLLRILIGLVFVVHGVGHVMAFLPALDVSSTDTWHYRSWLLTGLIGETASRVLVIILYGAAFLGFLAAALALFGWLLPHDWWRTLAVLSAIISLVALFLFWNSLATFFPNKIGAIVVNLAVLVGLLWLDWPSEAAIGFS